MRYRSVWLYGWSAVAVVCIGLAPMVWPISTVVMLFVVGAVAAGTVTFGYLTRDNVEAPGRGDLVAATARNACLGGAAVTAVSVAARMNGPVLLAVLVLVAVSSPYVVERLIGKVSASSSRRHADGGSSGAEAVGVIPLPPAGEVHDDKELCRLWRISFTILQTARHPITRERVVALRQGYLDELERRDPTAVTAWLASGPSAAGGPEQFLSRPEEEDFRQAS